MNKLYPSPLARFASLVSSFLLLFAICTNAQVRLVADLTPSAEGAAADETRKNYSLHASTSTRSFFVGDQNELWTSDGTAAGTILLKRFLQIKDVQVIGENLFISATTNENGCELWKSDGTVDGTILVKDIFAGTGSSSPTDLTELNGLLYFSSNGGPVGRELWVSDGTTAGTQLLKDIQVGSISSNPARLVVVNNTLFFVANDGTSGYELWSSNGTPAGTTIVKDIHPDAGKGSAPNHLTSVNGKLIFSAESPSVGRQLWRSDGTSAGTSLIRIIRGGGYPTNIDKLTNVNGTVFFQAQDGTHGIELWKSDGTSAGTVLVKDITPGSGSATSYPSEHLNHLAAINGKLFFTAITQPNEAENIWVSDGTTEGTLQITTVEEVDVRSINPGFTAFNGQAYFVGRRSGGISLFKSDGTPGSVVEVKNLNASWNYHFLTDPKFTLLNSQLYFFDNGYYWKTSGSDAGTATLKQLDYPGGSFPGYLVNMGGTLYFATKPDGLWKTTGTSGSTTRVSTIIATELTSYNNLLYMTGSMPRSNEYTAYRSDGVPNGTFQLNRNADYARYFTGVNNTVYFSAYNSSLGEELWSTDGTTTGTRVVKDINPGTESTYPRNLSAVGSQLLFTAFSPSSGDELWRSDGTNAGTYLVKDLFPGMRGSDIESPVTLNGNLFFQANDGVNGTELWRSNGTTEGTVMVQNIRSSDCCEADMGNIITNDNLLFFTALNESGRSSLWTSTGVSGGTTKIKDFESSVLGRMIARTPTLVYFVFQFPGAMELWKTDGTAAGTIRLKKFNEQFLSNISKVAVLENIVYFATEQMISGKSTIWRTDGTFPGTYSIPFDGRATNFTTSGPYVYFTGLSQQYGSELFLIDEGVSSSSESVAKIVDPSDETLSAYPNPFRSGFTLNLKGNANEHFAIKVLSSNGQSISSETLPCNVDHSVGSTWRSGMYVLQIQQGNRITTKKVIKLGD